MISAASASSLISVAVTPNWEKEARRVVQSIKDSAPDDEGAQEKAQDLEKALEDYYKLDYEDLVPHRSVSVRQTVHLMLL